MSDPRVLFVGDTLLRTSDGSDPFLYVGDLWDQHDLIILNLENPIVENCQPTVVKASTLSTKPSAVKWLERFRDKLFICFANNHILDCGNAGYIETKWHLDAAKIKYCPLDSPCTTTIGGLKLNIYALYKGIENDFQKTFFKPDNSEMGTWLPQNEINIAFCHWGDEYVLIPTPRIVKLVDRLRTIGFQVIVGHHSHSAQGVVVHPDGCVISYSLGNFNFLDPLCRPEWVLPRLGYMLSVRLGTQPLVWKRYYYLMDKFGRPIALTSDVIDTFYRDMDKILGNYQSLPHLFKYIIYLSHSSRQFFWSNFYFGWLPRTRKEWGKQMFLFLLWAVNYRQIIRYPFLIIKKDRLWNRYSRFLEEWSNYLDSSSDALRNSVDLRYPPRA